MNLYSFLSIGYDLLDKIWFSDKGKNPRDVIKKIIPNEKCNVLDMCCGTFSNGMSIVKNNPNIQVIGLDRSEAMLKEARRKIEKENLKNVKLLCQDATQTGLESDSFDYIILGLVLHECDARLWKKILDEAHRLLKKDGKLIVLEWDKQTAMSRKIKFAPLYATETLGNLGYFRKFYNMEKSKFFKKYRFKIFEKHTCNYSAVMVLKKF